MKSDSTMRLRNTLSIRNKKASFEFIFLEEFVAGVSLVGTEVKSIKTNGASFTDSYCYFKDNELFLKNLHISECKLVRNNEQHEPKRDRKLLLTKRELKNLKESSLEKGLTIIPTKLFMNDKGLIKVSISLCKGKKLYDKRVSLREKEEKKNLRAII